MANVYEIATKISMSNGVSPVLAVIAKEVLGLEGGLKNLQKSFDSLRFTLAAGGGMAILGGGAILGGLKSIADHGDKLLDQQDKLQRAGVQLNEVLRLQSKYYSDIGKAVPTSTVSEYLKTYNELRSVVGADEAEKVTPWSMKMESLISNMTGRNAEGEGFKLWRAMEMTGRTISDPAGTQKLADALVQNIIGSGGKLDANIYQTMARRGGVAWANASPAFLAGPMSVVGADLGGDTAGTAMMSAYMFMTGANTLSKQQYEVLNKAGLIDQNKVTTDKGGRVNVQPGGIVGSGKYTGEGKFDLYGWTQEFLGPGLQKLSKGDRAVFDSLIAKVGRNRNVMRMLTMFSDPSFVEQINKDLAQWKQASGVDQSYDDAMKRNPAMIKKGFNDQYESMMQSIGAPMMQAAIPVMKEVTNLFNSIGKFANENPDAIKKIAEGFAILGGFLVGAGAAALIAAIGAGGWFVVGIGLLGAAVVAFRDQLSGVIDAAKAAADAVGRFVNAIKEIAGQIGSAISGFMHSEGGGGGGRGRSNLHYQSYRPAPPAGGGGGPTPIHLYIDGEQVHSAVIKAEYRASEHVRQAPSFDGLRHFPAADSQIWDT